MAALTVAARVGEVARTTLATVAETAAIFTEVAKIIIVRADDALDDISLGLRKNKAKVSDDGTELRE